MENGFKFKSAKQKENRKGISMLPFYAFHPSMWYFSLEEIKLHTNRAFFVHPIIVEFRLIKIPGKTCKMWKQKMNLCQLSVQGTKRRNKLTLQDITIWHSQWRKYFQLIEWDSRQPQSRQHKAWKRGIEESSKKQCYCLYAWIS